jgi:rubrerythrin
MRDNLRRALDFAAAKEAEAEAFYKGWSQKVSDPRAKALFAELGAVEHGHREVLLHLVPSEIVGSGKPVPAGLGVAEFLVNVRASTKASLQDAMVVAMKREEVSAALYDRLSEFGGETAALFRALAEEERRHRRVLETEYERGFLGEN